MPNGDNEIITFSAPKEFAHALSKVAFDLDQGGARGVHVVDGRHVIDREAAEAAGLRVVVMGVAGPGVPVARRG